ncbi:hypothetical protein, partial [Vibrio splendidus]|uniref:hypothetical protein n=1 Tax=Vibrio splendidus TaxID=29497 RepID=UPI001C0FC591
MKKKVLLFHPSNYYGGASVLFYRIFVHLQSINTDVYYFDRNDGFTTSLSNNKDRIIYDVEKLPFDVNSEYVVICTTTNFSKARKAFLGVSEQPTYKVWSVHPYEFGPNFYYLGRLSLIHI